MRTRVAVIVALVLCCVSSLSFAGEPIKIGAFFALSGPAANIGTPTKLVAQMVVDKINLGGAMETHCPLHAAAPDLLAALKGLVQVIQELGECNRPEYEKAWAAISRAEGKE